MDLPEVPPLTTIVFEVGDDHVATITLDRPDKLNSFNETMTNELSAVWARVRDDDSIHAVVLRANGDRAFCTGLDIAEGAWWTGQNVWNQTDPGAVLGPRHQRVWKPVIAAVHGMCAGGGMYFINDCDIIICSESATFFDPHANGGIVSALEPIGMLHRGVPLGDVLRWALMGNDERITAATALRIGLVTEVVPDDELRARAADIAQQIAARRPEAVQGTVRAIWEALDMSRSTALQNGLAYTHIGNPAPEDRQAARQPNRKPTFR
jgi:enoyl-CoA hydratase/carnithine racemase